MPETPQRSEVPERGLLIGGKSVPASSGNLTDDISPWNGEVYARVAAGTVADITRAADAAQAAFPSWSSVGAFERREIFLKAADVMARRSEEAIAALAQETGASRVFSEFNVAFCIQVLREAAAAITRPMGELLATSIPGAYSMAQRIPFGVVGAISPWNAPLVLGMRSIAIPLAVGNTVVMKPSEDAPITCGLLLAGVLTEAGLPAGVLNVVTNDLADAGDVVAALIADPRVRMVNFTGSTNVGRIIGVQAAHQLKPAVLELGGKNPLIILEDADPDLAVDAAVFGAFMNSGQICMSTRWPAALQLNSKNQPDLNHQVRLIRCKRPVKPDRRNSSPDRTRRARRVSGAGACITGHRCHSTGEGESPLPRWRLVRDARQSAPPAIPPSTPWRAPTPPPAATGPPHPSLQHQ
jgi:acyl-CoA reductase-like NAD-dependent aldehyde dehydrogenase